MNNQYFSFEGTTFSFLKNIKGVTKQIRLELEDGQIWVWAWTAFGRIHPSHFHFYPRRQTIVHTATPSLRTGGIVERYFSIPLSTDNRMETVKDRMKKLKNEEYAIEQEIKKKARKIEIKQRKKLEKQRNTQLKIKIKTSQRQHKHYYTQKSNEKQRKYKMY